ncbi:hypothetical protein MIB92_00180 [Aestuariirhabdus sp. Z084]|uniref:COG4648 family protein n=1 Tax=Aestuariirhabdus haliotis TaxID=2918751 RepID=UPI00201B3DDD|nr:hypothetical protein [Aestuariirhabdus haliotis]MCL6414052.1 hypothetical protein [Aestuariirhabdus haliotis]MCL6417985.1 hypothetical protein [Aestuariirhabdus haliotis]
MERLLSLLLGVLVVLYPIAVYLGLSYWEPSHLGWLLLVLFSARLLLGRRLAITTSTRAIAFVGIAVAALSLLANSDLPFRFYPVAVNTLMLILFGLSLRHGPSFVERIARLQDPDLPESGVRYTRRVTQIWCLFFMVNGSIALYTALYASLEHWTLYNGLIAYGLMATLAAGEWIYRRLFIAHSS